MDRVVAILPETVEELCLLRFGLYSRRWTGWAFVRRMGRIIAQTAHDRGTREAGLLHSEAMRFAWNHAGVLQYWRSYDALESWSHRPPHSEWWRLLNERVRRKRDVGVYHETFLVPRTHYESIFVNCPPLGGSAFGALGPPTGGMTTSRDRLGRRA
jgi:hypothetical protein